MVRDGGVSGAHMDEKMNGESYKDRDGNPTTLEALCRSEPEWACSQIRHLRNELHRVKKDLDEARAEYLGGSRSDVQPMTNPKTEAQKDELLTIAQSLVEIKSKVEGSSPQLDAEYERFFSKWVEILGSCVAPQDDEGD